MMRCPTQQELVRLSRDRFFLLKSSLALAGGSTVLALLVSLITPADSSGPDAITAPGKSGLISLIRFGLPPEAGFASGTCAHLLIEGEKNPFSGLIESALAKEPDELIEIWWKGLGHGNTAEAIARLESAEGTLRYRNEFIADLKMKSADSGAALQSYLAEAANFEEADYARRSALFLARFEEDRALTRKLLADTTFRRAFAPAERLPYEAYAKDYAGLAVSVILTEWGIRGTAYVVPALFTAAIWFFVLLSFCERSGKNLITALLAFVLGIVSAGLTLYAVALQEHLAGQNFNPADSPFAQFIYFLSGVALREEFLKLLCFLPLAILIRRAGSPIRALILAGMVGLGFAFQENLIYFQASPGTFTAWLRLLTANALHFSLTGVAGFYLWQMLHRRFRGWEEFLFSFIAVVFAHALYNAILSMPALDSYAPLSPFLVAVIAYHYFDPLRLHMETTGLHRRVSPLGIFIFGSAVLTCTILVSSAVVEPFRFALGAFASSLAAMIPLSFAFISRFRDL